MPENVQSILRTRIRDYCNYTQTSQRNFAKKVGCSAPTMNMFLKGHRSLEPHWMERSLTVMGMEWSDLDTKGKKDWELVHFQTQLETLYRRFRYGFRCVANSIDCWIKAADMLRPGAERIEEKEGVG